MILSETSSRRPSRIAFGVVLGIGALLLPLAPQTAWTQTPKIPRRPETSPRKPSTTIEVDRQEAIEKLQDEIELLKVQVRIKEVRIQAAKQTMKEYQRRRTNYISVNRVAPGAIPTDTLAEIELAITKYEAQSQIYEAEIQEPRVRLKQAERRLARLQHPAEKTDGERGQREKRLRELELKVEILQKEIHKMREDLRPNKPQ